MDFAGSIPDIYDRFLVPLLFEPYAEDLAARLAAEPPGRALELAAGTGVVTAAVARALPATRIVATDISQPMLDVAAKRAETSAVEFRTADAQDLPFEDAGFDAVYCQFGVMFLPDRQRAYAGMRRVLRGGGRLLFSSWASVDDSALTLTVDSAVSGFFAADPPQFMRRVPHGYHDPAAIRDALHAAGFGEVDVETVRLRGVSPSARDVAVGFCQGTPIRNEIVGRGGDPAAVTDAVTAAVADRFGDGEVQDELAALVVTAR